MHKRELGYEALSTGNTEHYEPIEPYHFSKRSAASAYRIGQYCAVTYWTRAFGCEYL